MKLHFFYSHRKLWSYSGVTYSCHFSVGWIPSSSCMNQRQERTSALCLGSEQPEVSRRTSSPTHTWFFSELCQGGSFNWELYSHLKLGGRGKAPFKEQFSTKYDSKHYSGCCFWQSKKKQVPEVSRASSSTASICMYRTIAAQFMEGDLASGWHLRLFNTNIW